MNKKSKILLTESIKNKLVSQEELIQNLKDKIESIKSELEVELFSKDSLEEKYNVLCAECDIEADIVTKSRTDSVSEQDTLKIMVMYDSTNGLLIKDIENLYKEKESQNVTVRVIQRHIDLLERSKEVHQTNPDSTRYKRYRASTMSEQQN